MHIARELDALVHDELHIGDLIVARGCADANVLVVCKAVEVGSNLVVGLRMVDIGQVVEDEVAALVSLDSLESTIRTGGDNLCARNTRTIRKVEETRDVGSLYTLTWHHLGVTTGTSLAVVHATHLIQILVDGRGGLVLVLGL